MASLFVNEELPTTSEQAIRQFDERYLVALSQAPDPTWVDRFVIDVGAPRVTFPIALMSAKFRETKEKSGRFKTMAEEAFDLKVVEFDDGFEAPFLDLTTNVFAYRNWNRVPQAFVKAERKHVAINVAALLEAGTTTVSPWDKVNFWSANSHLANPSAPEAGTFGNYNSTVSDPTDVTVLQTEMTAMRGVLDENGDKLGVEPTEIWLPTAKFQKVSDLLNQDRLANGESNPIKGKLTPIHIPQLTTADWYLADPVLMAEGIDPCVAASYTPADTLGLRYYDESSDYFKDTGNLKIGKHIWKGFALVFPHAVRRIAG